MRTFKNQAAQGDVFIRRICQLPSGIKSVNADNGIFTAAHSETGHSHIIKAHPNIKMYTTDDPLLSYLEVIEATDETEALLEHLRSFDTHETIRIPPGVYELRRQREYTPEGWRRVED